MQDPPIDSSADLNEQDSAEVSLGDYRMSFLPAGVLDSMRNALCLGEPPADLVLSNEVVLMGLLS